MITNQYNTVLYIGVTNNLIRRIYEHKNKLVEGFSSKYNLNKLVYFEQTESIESAILREKQLKKYSRAKKEKLIETINPEHNDLYESLI
jgi:putative endonuclease